MDLNVVIMDTVRETDGLAMSSRNAYLKPDERAAASILYRSLHAAKVLYEKEGRVVKSSDLVSIVENGLKSEPLVSEIQYISVDSKETMQPISEQVGTYPIVGFDNQGNLHQLWIDNFKVYVKSSSL